MTKNAVPWAYLCVFIGVTGHASSEFVAVLSGIAGFRKWGDLWLSFRLTEELLKEERFLYLARAGHYAQAGQRFPDFVMRVESIISSEHQKFRTVIEQARKPQKDPGS